MEEDKGGYDYDVGQLRAGSVADIERQREMVERKGSTIGEAAVLYGDVETAEKYGYVARGLKSRHIQFIALGGAIGTGLFVGIGGALASYGPLAILLGYSITGVAIFTMMMSLGEIVTWLPLPGAVPQICARYVDPAMGFAVGWNTWYSYALTLCSEISAATIVVSFWEDYINPAVWVSVIIVIVIFLNIFAVSIYGEAEFFFASLKIITIVGLILMAFILDVGGGPGGHRYGFQYWNHPGPFNLPTRSNGDGSVIVEGGGGRFLAFFSTLINAAFSYGGVEMIAVAAGESENPRKNIPKAVKRTFWRILFFYVLGSLAIGVLVPYTNDELVNGAGANGSPWVIAIRLAGIPALPSIINAVIFTSATSSANAFLYTGSRYLFALAQNRQAPRFLLHCSKRGVPYYCVGITASISLLTYMTVSTNASTVFEWFLNLTTIANLFTWVSIAIASIRFTAAYKAQGIARDSLPFKAPFQPALAWISLVFFSIIIIFNGWQVFVKGNWSVNFFITSYIGIPIYFALYLFWKVLKREPFVKASEADLWTGKAAIDAEIWPEQIPRNFLEKIWFKVV